MSINGITCSDNENVTWIFKQIRNNAIDFKLI